MNTKLYKNTIYSALCALSCSFMLVASPVQADEAKIKSSRASMMQLGKTLKGKLQTAMKAGGPLEAISVCNLEAPEVAAAVSADTNMSVGRTSLKLRNQDNAPDEWEMSVLQKFEERLAAGEDVTKLDHGEVVGDEFRYMKAIPTDGVCLACHGEAVGGEIAARLDELYPEDKARGYQAGQIRGAFTISQPN